MRFNRKKRIGVVAMLLLAGCGLPSNVKLTTQCVVGQDQAKTFLDYPKNIQMFGMSFNTNLGSWSLAGEYSIRPQLPVQVQVPDVLFAALQPAFPKQDIPVNLGIVIQSLPQVLRENPNAILGDDPQKLAQFLAYLIRSPSTTTTSGRPPRWCPTPVCSSRRSINPMCSMTRSCASSPSTSAACSGTRS